MSLKFNGMSFCHNKKNGIYFVNDVKKKMKKYG